jgi:anti-sigma B factor antagonist
MDLKTDYITPKTVVVYPEGRLDAMTAEDMQKQFSEIIEQDVTRIVVDLSMVTFMDSSGLRVLISGLKAIRRRSNGELLIARANSQIKTALRLTMLDRVFPVYDSPEDALSTVKPV